MPLASGCLWASLRETRRDFLFWPASHLPSLLGKKTSPSVQSYLHTPCQCPQFQNNTLPKTSLFNSSILTLQSTVRHNRFTWITPFFTLGQPPTAKCRYDISSGSIILCPLSPLLSVRSLLRFEEIGRAHV